VLKLICQIGYWTVAIAVVLAEDKVKQFAQEFSMWVAVGSCQHETERSK
jgi:hypothetical protein